MKTKKNGSKGRRSRNARVSFRWNRSNGVISFQGPIEAVGKWLVGFKKPNVAPIEEMRCSTKGKRSRDAGVGFQMGCRNGVISFKGPIEAIPKWLVGFKAPKIALKKEIPKVVPKTMKYGKELHNQWHMNSVFFWCLHCERTYRQGECREIDGLQMCPYDGCDGDTFMDAWPWGSIRDCDPGYPVIPEEGKVYPMYPKKSKSAKGKK